tara:strand:- start:592 stop:1296 length:705 start_codon:yes stop_codon:yes gene_type:complete
MPEPGIGRPDERVAAAQAAMTSSGSVPAGAAQYIGGSDTTDVFSQVNDPARVAQEIYAATGGLEDILSKEDFFAQNNMTLTNPYGASPFGMDPSKVDYSGNLTEKQRRQIMDLAYDRYRNPFAEKNIFGDDVGGDIETGRVRSGLTSIFTSPMTYLGEVKNVPLPKSPGRSLAELAPAGLGLLIRMLPQEKMGMIDARQLPGDATTYSQGMEAYEQSKRTGSFLDNLLGMGRGK